MSLILPMNDEVGRMNGRVSIGEVAEVAALTRE
jgi:hypothetical protein